MGGNRIRRGWGGVTRSNHHSTGSDISAARTKGAPKFKAANNPIVSRFLSQPGPMAACNAINAVWGG